MVALHRVPRPRAGTAIQLVLLAKRFQRMLTEEPGGAASRRTAVTTQLLAQGTAGMICSCLRPGPAARRSSNQDAAGGSDARAPGAAAATAGAAPPHQAPSPTQPPPRPPPRQH